MRRFQKKQFIKQIELLEEACYLLKRQRPGKARINLCADMQELVSSLMDFLEKTGEEDAEMTGLFCELYKMLFKASQGEKAENQMLNQMKRIAICAEKKISDKRIEAAFFCYKASMSDCLESIYFAAKEDPDCDAYFIPVPYYDKNPDGTFGQMHYEAYGCYSNQYELTGWQEYHVEERHPDVIFIMSPYDECNYVTTVHPDFYARQLRMFTDLLVYIPYIIHSEVVDSCVGEFPGVLFADRVIVQSENVRRQYINSVLSSGCGISRKMAEKKIIAMGSPKTDKVLNSNKKDYVLPGRWRDVLGVTESEKKVLLYNLSIETALKHSGGECGGRYLDKLRSVFDFFKDREDVVLWWRPHPLLRQTFRSMRPEQYEAYESVIEYFQLRGFGIYDDSADMNRAVAFADACFGDESSVNLLLQFAGKPVLVQNMGNAGKEPIVSCSEGHMRTEMDRFVDLQHYNSFILYEAADTSKEGISLVDFVEHLDVIMEYSAEQSARFRMRYRNADGMAGKKIYEYTRTVLGG